MLGVVLLAMAVGFAGNQISPNGLPLVAPVRKSVDANAYLPMETASKYWREGTAIFLDARAPADYSAGHIGNAFNLPAHSFAEHLGAVAPMLAKDSPLVLYCDGVECDLSHQLRDNLNTLGFTNTHLLFNGWSAWKAAGLPVTKGAGI